MLASYLSGLQPEDPECGYGEHYGYEISADAPIRDDLQAGARNLFDQNYQLVGGFPSEGRSFSLNLRVR